MTDQTHILSVTSSRADVGILTPVWRALSRQETCRLTVLATGMHRAETDDVGDQTIKAHLLERAGTGAEVILCGKDLGGIDAQTSALAMGAIVAEAGSALARTNPDLLLLIGDRLDMIPVGLASLGFNIPIAHLHGGEVTEGAIDDRVRHAITKLSHLHLVSCGSAADRVAAMSEESWRIHITGAPGLDTLRMSEMFDRARFFSEVGLSDETLDKPLILATVHPETNAPEPMAPLDAVLDALDSLETPTLFTAANSDPGGRDINRRVAEFAGERHWCTFVDTLGSVRYPNALRHAAAMVGNSSSGIVEAGLFGLPTVNVGDRQAGRERGNNVTDVSNDARAVRGALEAAQNRADAAAPDRLAGHETPYGAGFAAQKVVDILMGNHNRERLLRKRVDIADGARH